MEDFGYKKNYDNQDRMRSLLKQGFLSLAALFSLAAFIYVTVTAYRYIYSQDQEVRTIKSPEFPIKVIEEEVENNQAESGTAIDRKIYEDIFGNKNHAQTSQKIKIQDSPAPALPPKVENIAEKTVEKNPEKPSEKPIAASQKAAPEKADIIVFNDKEKEKSRSVLGSEKRDNSAAPAKKPSGKRAAIRVQIAAMSSKESAKQTLERLEDTYPALFKNIEFYVEKVDLGKRGIFYRLQLGNFFNQVEAESFCSRYVASTRKASSDCIIVE